MAIKDNLKSFTGGGMDSDSAYEAVDPNDYIEGYCIRSTGTGPNDDKVPTNIESTTLIANSKPFGLNRGCGGERFETIRLAVTFNYNSGGFHQISTVNPDTKVQTVIFTNITDTAGINIMPLNPKFFVTDIKLVNDTILIFTDGNMPPCYINLTRLIAGGYGVLTQEDILLIKAQPLTPPLAIYGNDASRSVNLMDNRLFMYIEQWVYLDDEYSAWSMRSKRVVPGSQTTPIVGTDVTVNNNQIISVDAGTDRVKQINIGAQYNDLEDFFLIKSALRSYIIALPNASVDISNQIYEAYDPIANIYSFVFYNDGLYDNIPPNETDLPYDYVPLTAGTVEIIDENIVILGNILEGYPRPPVNFGVTVTNYDPNLTLPPPGYQQLFVQWSFGGDSGSGLGNHKRLTAALFGGVPKNGDIITFRFVDIRDSNNVEVYPYTVSTSDETGGLVTLINSLGLTIPNSNIFPNNPPGTNLGSGVFVPYFTTGQYGIANITDPYFQLAGVGLNIFNAGASSFRSINAWKLNSSYQFALRHRDDKGRFFPIATDNTSIIKTQSYAQSHGLTPSINITITGTPPPNADNYVILATKNNTHDNTVPVNAVLINYIATWNASSNSPALSAFQGGSNPGDTYQVQVAGSQNIGDGTIDFNAGDYAVYNGTIWERVDKSIGNLTTVVDYLFVKIDPLQIFNDRNSSTVLFYDWALGDRCTFNYYTDADGLNKVWFDNPAVDVEIVSQSNYLIKIRKSSAITVSTLVGKNLFLELYSPKKRTVTVDNVVGLADTLFFEIGEEYPIVNGQYSQTSIILTQGDIYFKTLQLVSAVNHNDLLNLVVEDFNYSVYFPSKYNSYGRPGTYDDTALGIQSGALSRFSLPYPIGSKTNGLTRFFGENSYGNNPGETQSAWGAINKLKVRGQQLVIIQELNEGYSPIYSTIIYSQSGQQQLAVSDKLLNSIQYPTNTNIGMGNLKATYAYRNGNIFYLDPNKSLPIRSGLDGQKSIAGKKSKFFKEWIQSGVAAGNIFVGVYDDYNEEYIISKSDDGDTFQSISFLSSDWEVLEPYTIVPADIVSVSGNAHGSLSYSSITGLATFLSSTLGNDGFNLVFDVAGNPITKHACITVVAVSTEVNQFLFAPQFGQPLNTFIFSNTVSILGNEIPVAISITGGFYSINGGAYTSSAGTVNAGDIVQVKVLSSSSDSTPESCTLTVSTTSATFTVTTIPFTFAFTPQIGVNLSTNIVSNTLTYSGPTETISIVGGQYSINGGGFTSSPGSINNGDTFMVEVMSSASNNVSTSCTLTIGTVSAPFTVTTYSLIAGILVVDIFSDTSGNFCGYINTPGATIPYQVPVYTGQNFMPGVGTPAAQNWALASDVVFTSIAWRFEFNITQLVATYPAETSFVFIISGRDISAGSLSGSYVVKSTTGSSMVMTGSPGSYLPTASGPNIGITSYSGRTTVGGADGTYGVGVGAVIMTFTYDTTLNTITLT